VGIDFILQLIVEAVDALSLLNLVVLVQVADFDSWCEHALLWLLNPLLGANFTREFVDLTRVNAIEGLVYSQIHNLRDVNHIAIDLGVLLDEHLQAGRDPLFVKLFLFPVAIDHSDLGVFFGQSGAHLGFALGVFCHVGALAPHVHSEHIGLAVVIVFTLGDKLLAFCFFHLAVPYRTV